MESEVSPVRVALSSAVTVVPGPNKSVVSALLKKKVSAVFRNNVEALSVTVLPFRAVTYPLNPSVY